jgi:hypothetical protein
VFDIDLWLFLLRLVFVERRAWTVTRTALVDVEIWRSFTPADAVRSPSLVACLFLPLFGLRSH